MRIPDAAAAHRRCVVVLGSGRSGTSVAAQVLGHVGVAMSASLDAAGDQNPLGFAEDATIVQRNKDLIEEFSVGSLFPPDLSAMGAELGRAAAELGAYIEERVAETPLWGFKDPRTAFLLPLYRRVFNSRRIVPSYVLCVRDPAHVVASLTTNYGHDADLAQLFWFSKNLAALRETGLNCFVLHYDRLLADPLDLAERLSRFVHDGADPPEVDRDGVRRTVRPALDRSIVDPAEITNPFVRELYEGLRRCDGQSFDRQALSELVRRLGKVEAAFAPWPRAAAQRTTRLRRNLRQAEARARSVERDCAALAGEDIASRRELERHCWDLLDENARLVAEWVEAQSLAEDYQRRALAATEQAQTHEAALAKLERQLARQRRSGEEELRALKEKHEREQAQAHEAALAKLERQLARQRHSGEEELRTLKEKHERLARRHARQQRRSEQEQTALRQRIAEHEAAATREEGRPALAEIRAIERDRARSELPHRLGELVLDTYRRPLARGWRLPAALLRLRAERRGAGGAGDGAGDPAGPVSQATTAPSVPRGGGDGRRKRRSAPRG